MTIKEKKTMLKKRNRRQGSNLRKQRVKIKLSTAMNKIHNQLKLIHLSLAPNLETNLDTLVTSVLRAFAHLWV